jgi:hypothetical protein
MAKSDLYTIIFNNSAEGSWPLETQIKYYGIEPLVSSKKILLIGGAQVDSKFACLTHEHFLSHILDYQENIEAQSSTDKIFEKTEKPFKFLFLNGRARPHRKYLYEKFNVREYWIVNPTKKVILVLNDITLLDKLKDFLNDVKSVYDSDIEGDDAIRDIFYESEYLNEKPILDNTVESKNNTKRMLVGLTTLDRHIVKQSFTHLLFQSFNLLLMQSEKQKNIVEQRINGINQNKKEAEKDLKLFRELLKL